MAATARVAPPTPSTQDPVALLAAFEAALEATADGILAVDRDGAILHVNQQFARMWGMPPDLVARRDRAALLAFSAAACVDGDAFLAATRDAYANPERASFDLLALRDGRTLERRSAPAQVGGRVIGRVWSVRDVTARVRAEEELRQSEERFRVLSDSAAEGVLVNVDGIIVACNDAFARLVGAPREQVIGMRAVDCAAPESRADVVRHVQQNDPTPYEVLGLRRDGTTFPAEISGRSTTYQGRPARVATIRDLSLRKKAEEARQAEERQRAEIAQLRAVNEFRTGFINNAAHELATPLTPIQLQMAALRLSDQDPARSSRYQLIERNFARLQRIIRDLLDAARLQSDHLKVQPAPLDITDLVQHVAQTFQPAAEQQGQHVVVELGHAAGTRAMADPERTEQVLCNLLGNAIKFTPVGGRIRLATREEPGGILVEVEDSGIGLSPQQAQRLFQPFTQVHEGRRPGTGLGLYISRGIVERQGGRITVASPGPGKGSTFTFMLPRASPPAPTASAASRRA